MILFYTSSNKTDKCSVTIISTSIERADKLIARKFKSWNYKGKPKRLAI